MKKRLLLGVFCFLIIFSISVFSIPNDYIAFWKFNGNADDETGSYDGSFMGDAKITFDAERGEVLDLDGSSDAVNFGDADALIDSVVTYSFWVKARDSSDGAIINKMCSPWDSGILILKQYTDDLRVHISHTAPDAVDSDFFSASGWIHGVVVLDGGNVSIYKNGVLATGPNPITHPPLDNNFDFHTGDQCGMRWLNGYLDDVMVYNKALSSTEIEELYNSQKNPDKLVKLDVQTCQGEGELYLYQETPFQDLDVSLTTNRDELYIFTRADYISSLDVKLNGISTSTSLVVSKTTPFDVKVYKVNTSPGDLVSVTDSSVYDSRAIQGYLVQDSSNPAYDIENLNIVYDDVQSNTLYLYPGTYSYILFDKYSLRNNGNPDNRKLNIQVKDGSVIVDKDYFQPSPSPVEGVVKDDYTITTEGEYEFVVDTEDSVYWFLLECEAEEYCGDGILQAGEECDDGNNINGDGCDANCKIECEDEDRDCVCDEDDECLNSLPGEMVNEEGCDPFQFCREFYCGSCDYQDFIPKFQNCEPIDAKPEEVPHDCVTVMLLKEGTLEPGCFPTTCAD